MKATIVVVAFSALVLSGCDQPLEPTTSRPHVAPRPASVYIRPTGDAIAYRSCDPETGGCYLVVQTDGSVVTSVTWEYPTEDNSHSWSPDGTKIAVSQPYAGEGIVVVTLADDSEVNLTANSQAVNHSPDWSPDGARIAFVSDRDGQLELYLMNAADGSNLTRLTNSVGVRGGPSWSPDGMRIAFTCAGESGNSAICAINTDGSGFVHLTTGAGNDFDPDFSPDGTKIAFVTDRDCTPTVPTCTGDGFRQLYLMNVADGSVAPPATRIAVTSNPDWSPAGDRIAYTGVWYRCDESGSNCSDQESVYLVKADGSGASLQTGGAGPAWRPNTLSDDAPPTAEFSSSCVLNTCTFDSSASADDYGVTGLQWSFGDGTSSGWNYPGYTYTHSYAAGGTYTVTLTVSDNAGQTGSITHVVTVTDPPDNPPVARFSASCVGRTCAFQSGASSDDYGIVSRAWTFGDGTSAGNVIAPSHKYAGDGTYSVTLTLSDKKGQTNSVTHTVTVADLPPVARFTYGCSAAYRGQTSCYFDGTSSSDDVGIVSYSWSLGDKGPATGAVVNAAFKSRGTQVITLTVKDAENQSSTTSQTISLK